MAIETPVGVEESTVAQIGQLTDLNWDELIGLL
jgi:hypothetical protein